MKIIKKNKITKKNFTTWIFVFQKYGKFWSVLQEHFIKHKPLISEECCIFTKKKSLKIYWNFFCYYFLFFFHKRRIIYLKPLVHLTKLAFAKPCCSHGNENVKPKGKISFCNSRFWTKSARQLAIWSKSWVPVPVKY